MYSLDIIKSEMPCIKSNSNARKTVTYMSSEVQGQVWVGIRDLESTALRIYLNP